MLSRTQINIKEIINSYLSLEKKGSNYWAICPFHDDTRASFAVSEEKNIFKCFACGVSGDALSFIMRKDNLSFSEALIKAHRILKLPIDNVLDLKNVREESLKKKLLLFNNFALEFFEASLFSVTGSEALKYLTNTRKISIELIKKMRLGYAPKNNSLFQALERFKKHSQENEFIDTDFLLKTGIFSINSKTQKPMVLFQDRIIFPIFSKAGEIIGFSSRRLKDSSVEAKYLNSRETLLFKKALVLYNFPSLNALSPEKPVYLFEGPFDLFSSIILEPKNVSLALMGSELSNEIFKSLSESKITKIVLCLDSDEAGFNSSLKLAQKLISRGIKPLSLPLDFKGHKDLSEIFAKGLLSSLPLPIDFFEWLQLNKTQLVGFAPEDFNTLPLNQLVRSFICALFQKRGNFFEFKSEIDPIFAGEIIQKIFSLYQIIELSERERDFIERQKKSYIEAIRLSSVPAFSRYTGEENFQSHLAQENSISLVNYSKLLELWALLNRSNSFGKLLEGELKNWKFSALAHYTELFKWILLPEENLFLNQLGKNLDHLDREIKGEKESHPSATSFKNIWDFFELYYSLMHSLIEKIEFYLMDDNLSELHNKLEWLEKIEGDKAVLDSQSSNIFNRLLKLEKNKQFNTFLAS